MPFQEEENSKSSRLPSHKFLSLNFWGIVLVLLGLAILIGIYFPLLKEETKYFFSSKGRNAVVLGNESSAQNASAGKDIQIIRPVDENFGLVIPKISANAKVIAGVDPNDPKIYEKALTQGVAQAKGTENPGGDGNIFIFAHSGLDLPEALRYNAVFYLLDKLETGDEIDLFYQGHEFQYRVTQKKVVNAEEVGYLNGQAGKKTVTLMACWPPGTTWQRMLVIGEQI